jgi:hypothetical protein
MLKFPANREKNREFPKIAPSSNLESPSNGVTAGSGCKFPTNKTGNYFRGTDNFDQGTGNLIDQK